MSFSHLYQELLIVPRSNLVRYSVAFVTALIAVAFEWSLAETLGGANLFLPVVAVAVTAVICGFLPALLATLFSISGLGYLILHPRFELAAVSNADKTHFFLFIFASGIVISVGAKIRSALIATEGRRDELELEKTARELFVNTMAHDLKNPLTAATAGIELLMRHSRHERTEDAVFKQVLGSIQRADNMISDLLDANLIHGGKLPPLAIQTIDLTELLRIAVRDYVLQYGNRFVLQAEENIVNNVCQKGMRRVLDNLVNNAVKYGEKESPISVALRQDDKEINVAVHNKGNPIPIEQQSALFNPAKRLQRAENTTGWGLGLMLVHGIVEAHHGYVHVSSSSEKGTTFTIYIPKNVRKFQGQRQVRITG